MSLQVQKHIQGIGVQTFLVAKELAINFIIAPNYCIHAIIAFILPLAANLFVELDILTIILYYLYIHLANYVNTF